MECGDGYQIREGDGILTYKDGSFVPAACDECRAGQRGKLQGKWGEGHFKCSNVPLDLLEGEVYGDVTAQYVDGQWVWVHLA